MNLFEEALKKIVEYAVVAALAYMVAMVTRVSKKEFSEHMRKEDEYKDKVIGALQNDLQTIRQRVTEQNTVTSVTLARLESGQQSLEKRVEQGFQMLERAIKNEHS